MSGVRDNLSGGISRCSQISNLAVVTGFSAPGTINATWTNPSDAKYKGVRIMYKTGSYPSSPTDGSVFYDSNDATPVSTYTKTGFTDGTTYYLRAFAYTYKNATRLYTTTTSGAQASGVPSQVKGELIFTSSGNFTAPSGVNAVDIFLVGGGGGGAYGGEKHLVGGGGGYTKTVKNVVVTPGASYPIVIGAGGAGGTGTTTGTPGGNGGDTTIVINGTTHKATGGYGGGSYLTDKTGNGGSGGGASGPNAEASGNPTGSNGGDGGTDGSNGYRTPKTAYEYLIDQGRSNAEYFVPTLVEDDKIYSQGQGSTTRAFGDSAKTLYSGGGGSPSNGDSSTLWVGAGGAGGGGKGGGHSVVAGAGTANTGGGGGTGSTNTNKIGGNGGSGIVIIRWGY